MSNSDYRITTVEAREILDSRGNPTVQVDVRTETGFGRFSVPSGASKGRFEAIELRDRDPSRYLGLGVLKAVENVRKHLAPKVKGMDARQQGEIDSRMLELDGTPNKSHLGANSILGVSGAVARAAADTARIPLYKFLAHGHLLVPVPMMNILNGGKHAGNELAFQEFMIIPAGLGSFREALRCGSEVYHVLGKSLEKKLGRAAVNVGDEGGFAPPMKSVHDALEEVNFAIEEAGYSPGREVLLGIDPAADSFFDEKSGTYRVDGKSLSAGGLFNMYCELCDKFPLRSIEDPFHDEDFVGFAKLTKRLGSGTQIVGDDLFVTNSARLEEGVSQGAANALLVKLNQAGTITETVTAVETARKAEYGLVVSHRSGETEDSTIADVAVAYAAGQIKTGAPARGERTMKYNRLLEIEAEIGTEASFFGPAFLEHHWG
ncbi:phosphopyruvate hydratase [Candidatus Bathyarchaeota archaeon]|nr:MAG: phosphopyruvate hydratase [Candidatus Bathyarchaeota archaeon]TMI30828.1 MAG: phosphopyruvate hydratase [Candidatus Bathyarchaeota archaeon]